jgi:hypothetical protein
MHIIITTANKKVIMVFITSTILYINKYSSGFSINKKILRLSFKKKAIKKFSFNFLMP